MKRVTIVLLALGGVVAVTGLTCVSSYNRLVALDQAVTAQWSQVENVYQRRADLVPNLVETVKGAANFEKDTLTKVTEARAQVGKVTLGKDVINANKQYTTIEEQVHRFLVHLCSLSDQEALHTSGVLSKKFWLHGALSKLFCGPA